MPRCCSTMRVSSWAGLNRSNQTIGRGFTQFRDGCREGKVIVLARVDAQHIGFQSGKSVDRQRNPLLSGPDGRENRSSTSTVGVHDPLILVGRVRAWNTGDLLRQCSFFVNRFQGLRPVNAGLRLSRRRRRRSRRRDRSRHRNRGSAAAGRSLVLTAGSGSSLPRCSLVGNRLVDRQVDLRRHRSTMACSEIVDGADHERLSVRQRATCISAALNRVCSAVKFAEIAGMVLPERQ